MNYDEPEFNWVSILAFLLLGYLCVFVESRLMFFREFMGTQIDFLPGLIVYGALGLPGSVALFSAGVFGLLYDSLSANPFGTTMGSLIILAWITMQYREVLLSDQFTTHWVLGLIASAVAPAFSLFILYLAGEQPLTGAGTVWQWVIMSAGGGVITPVWFRLFRRFDSALRYQALPESAFRQDREMERGRH
jgi:rod shape-determining protein MreD